MDFDPALLARMQFAFTVTFHIIFPTFTIGLSAYIATLGIMWVRCGEERYHQLMRFWTRIFAVSFAMGVVSGLVLSYQFGTNWSRFSVTVGNVVGYELKNGIAYPTDWLAVIFNPTFPYRFAHMLNAAYVTTGFVVLAVGARYLLAGRHIEEGRTMLRMAIGLTAVLAPLQLVIGDQHGLDTLKYQPIKIAAIEAHWDGTKPGDFHIFAWPDEKTETNHFALSIPNASSLILTHRLHGLFPGLKSVPASDRPPVPIVFFAFRIMLAMGLFMIGTALFGAFLWWRGSLFDTRWYLQVMAQCWWVGFVAVIAGWITTESGRQPWIVEKILRTADATSPVIGVSIFVTLVLFVLAYGVVFSFGIYYINRLIDRGPEGPSAPRRPLVGAPITAAHGSGREGELVQRG
jgi:cytochrome d ubiquinol oxidase subunit I